MTVIAEIAREREAQITKGYDAAHDDEHEDGEIALAAICYAAPGLVYVKDERANATIYKDPWPWDDGYDNRRSNGNVTLPNYRASAQQRRRLLVKAAAMLVAEIERQDRLGNKTSADVG